MFNTIPVETIAMATLILLWVSVVMYRNKSCKYCGRPEKECICRWH